MQPIRIKACSESDLRMLGNLARNIQRVLPVTQADIDAAAALGKEWVVWKVIEVSDPIDNLRGGTQLVIKQNSITPGQNVRRVLIVQGPGGQTVVIGPAPSPLLLPDAIANSLSYVKAFGGTTQNGVPSGYTPLEYIEMTGAQYLDTGITGYANTNVLKTKINASQVSATCFITFQNPNSGADNLGLFLSSSRWNFQYGSPSRVTALASANTDVSIEATNGIMKINGVSVTGTPASEFSISEPILIGTAINGTTIEGRKFQGKIYYFRWEDSNGNVLFDGVPAKDSNNVAGMYDTVSGRFLTNKGSGSITAGPAITPTPDTPVDIVSNNGVLRIQGSATGTGTQAGDPTPTEPIYPVFYQKGDLVLRAVDGYADTYDATTQTITRNIGVAVFDGTERFTELTVPNAFRLGFPDRGMAGVNPMCSHYPAATVTLNVSSMPDKTVKGHATAANSFYLKDSRFETEAEVKAWFADQYNAGTPVIMYYVLETPITESFTPSVYADGTVETINAHGKNLFDKNSSLVNGYINSSGAVVSGNALKVSPFIEIKPNTTYTLSGTGDVKVLSYDRYAYTYTAEQTPIAQVPSQTGGASVTFTTAQNAKYIRIQTTPDAVNTCQLELGSTATEYAPYYNGGTATAEMLLKVGDYTDVQEILSGNVKRNVGVKVFDGTENWATSSSEYKVYSITISDAKGQSDWSTRGAYITHLDDYVGSAMPVYSEAPINTVWFNPTGALRCKTNSSFNTLNAWKNWLAAQYAAGTPVIVVYPLATETTESVAGQTLQVQAGDNTLEITQASMSGLELEAQYEQGVQALVEEIEP